MARKRSGSNHIWQKIKGQHLENKDKGVYGYMWWASLKIVALYIIIIIPLILIAKHLIDFERIFSYLTDNFSTTSVFVTFFISESLLGLIPPDLFMIWATKFSSPILVLLILGILSYLGGAVSYQIGFWFSKRPRIKAYTECKLEKYILLARKWGGAFIVVAALFPFSPLLMVAIAVGLLKYPFKLYLLFGISRIVRFLFQGLLYAGLFNMDSFFTSVF